ncbi:MAG: hypothetical protein Q9170_007201 [Blastenia crenularia]
MSVIVMSNENPDTREVQIYQSLRAAAKQREEVNSGEVNPNRRLTLAHSMQLLVTDCFTVAELSEIEENSQIGYPTLPLRGATDAEQARDPVQRNGEHTKSPDGASTFSGTTARISGAAQELPASGLEDMIDALEDLSNASNKVLDLLMPREISEASVEELKGRLLDLKSKESKQLQRRSPNFQAQRAVYGDDRFINVPVTVRVILDVPKVENARPGPWRMDPILYQTNIVNFLTSLMTSSGNNLEHTTNTLDVIFPKPFLGKFVTEIREIAEGSALLPTTLALALEIRTRYFVNSAKQYIDEPSFDPDALLQRVFYRDNDALNGWNVEGLRSDDVDRSRVLKTTIINRLDQLRRTFSESEAPFIDLGVLEKDFSQARLMTAIIAWCQSRLQEIEQQLQSSGGVVGVVQAIRNVVAGTGQDTLGTMDGIPSLDSNARVINQGSRHLSGQDQPNVSKATNKVQEGIDPTVFKWNTPKARPTALARLKERRLSNRAPKVPAEDPVAVSKTAPAPTTEVPPSTQRQYTDEFLSGTLPSWQPPETEEERVFAVPKPKQNLDAFADKVIDRRQENDAESNKENPATQLEPSQIPNSQPPIPKKARTIKGRFIDPQENAERMTWDSQETQSTVRQPLQPIQDAARSKKRGGEEEDEASLDADFEEDTRQIARPQLTRKTNAVNASPRPSPKRPRGLQDRQESSSSSESDEAVEAGNDDDAPVPSQGERYGYVNKFAKRATAMRPQKPQVRTPWSEDETNRLLELIDEHGISWSRLKEMDRMHEDGSLFDTRDQVALKDKARNIKFDYLKAGITMPRNFAAIPINKLQIQKLAGMGIRYDPETGR